MIPHAFGKVTVASAGTPVRLTSNEAGPANLFLCHSLLIVVDPDNTGFVYIGSATMNKATRVGVWAILAPPATATSQPASFQVTITDALNAINAEGFYVDADQNSDAVIASALVV